MPRKTRVTVRASEATCSLCKTTKDASAFHRHSYNANGLQAHCKDCLKTAYQARREELIEYNRQHRWEDQRVRMASDARRSDKAAGRTSTIRAKDTEVPESCPVTGHPIFHAVDQPLGCSPFHVRLDKTLEFVAGNWLVVSGEGALRRGALRVASASKSVEPNSAQREVAQFPSFTILGN